MGCASSQEPAHPDSQDRRQHHSDVHERHILCARPATPENTQQHQNQPLAVVPPADATNTNEHPSPRPVQQPAEGVTFMFHDLASAEGHGSVSVHVATHPSTPMMEEEHHNGLPYHHTAASTTPVANHGLGLIDDSRSASFISPNTSHESLQRTPAAGGKSHAAATQHRTVRLSEHVLRAHTEREILLLHERINAGGEMVMGHPRCWREVMVQWLVTVRPADDGSK